MTAELRSRLQEAEAQARSLRANLTTVEACDGVLEFLVPEEAHVEAMPLSFGCNDDPDGTLRVWAQRGDLKPRGVNLPPGVLSIMLREVIARVETERLRCLQ